GGTQFNTVAFPREINSNMYETRTTPTIQTQIVAPKATNINQTARFYIQAQNIGRELVSNFKLIATLPEHAKFVSSSPQPTNVEGNQYEFTFNTLNAKAKQVIQLDVTPTKKLPLNINTQIEIQANHRVAVTVQQPVLEISVDSPAAVQTGKTINHEVTVRNIGDGTAEGVRISTQRPTQLEVGSQVQKTLVPQLRPGQSTRFLLSSFATQAGDSNLVFEVTAKGVEARKASAPIRVIRPELGVQILGPGQNYLGREGTYTIQLENSSEMPITEVGVDLNVPNGLTIDTISRQAKINKGNNSLYWYFDEIQGNQKQVIQFRARATRVGNQVCHVNVKTKETASKIMSLETEVMGRADLSIRVTDSGAPVGIGSKTDFTIEVNNHGSMPAENVVVEVELPSELMPVNQPGYTVDPTGNSITFNNVTVEAGKKVNFAFKVVAVTAGEHVVKGTVSQENSNQSISSENSIFVFESENAKVSEALIPEVRR
ncbi:MAG: CARDB domain-containing protein, partial [Planctomycetota bacterium]